MKPRAAALSVILALALLAAPVPSPGQQPAKVYRIGWLGVGPPAPNDTTPQQCPIKGSPLWQADALGVIPIAAACLPGFLGPYLRKALESQILAGE